MILRGQYQGLISQLTLPHSTEENIRKALKGEDDYGIHLSREIFKVDLDVGSQRLVDDILDADQKHVELLKRLLH